MLKDRKMRTSRLMAATLVAPFALAGLSALAGGGGCEMDGTEPVTPVSPAGVSNGGGDAGPVIGGFDAAGMQTSGSGTSSTPIAHGDAGRRSGDGGGHDAHDAGGPAPQTPDAASDGGSAATGFAGCLIDGVSCTGIGQCCGADCTSSTDGGGTACGGYLNEGETCGPSTAPCYDNLVCTTANVCGTSACLPEGEACGNAQGGITCCNLDCNPVDGGARCGA
jgi:hypothetical protein